MGLEGLALAPGAGSIQQGSQHSHECSLGCTAYLEGLFE